MYTWNKIELGTCYYPEHWPKELWENDLERMKKTGIKTIRIAEFAWSKFEPREGEFTFDFFDEFMIIAKKAGMKIIFGTPTATPPAWLTNKYPEVLNATIDGVLYRHGARRHYNYNSIVYRKFCARIVDKISGHYGNEPSIIGWQIDNELNCETDEFYSESDTFAFRDYLKDKYKTLEALNAAWGSVFWNQTYTSWDEIYVPRTTLNNSTNPHEMLDYKRFISESAISFCKMQSDIIRKNVGEGVFITTNGMFGNLDNHRMLKECLDVYTYDSYPNFAYSLKENPKDNKDLNDRKWSNKLSEVRSICANFGIMEQQSGANGWNTRMESPAPKPGQIMLWVMQSMAHGADYISFFRWRTACIGTEIYWHGILDYDNNDNRKLQEISQIYERITKIENIANAEYEAQVAVLRDYSNIWDSELDKWHERLERPSYSAIFSASQISHTPLDYIYYRDNMDIRELQKYKVVFYPHALILSEKKAEVLTAYVKAGGNLVLGCRAGMKDENGRCPMTLMPGLLADMVGAVVKDFTFVGPNDNDVFAKWGEKQIEMPVFNDILQLTDDNTKVLARYSGNYYENEIAMTENKVGKGKAVYLGSTFSRQNVIEILKYFDVKSPYDEVISLPESCELAVRVKDNIKYFFVLNFEHDDNVIKLKNAMIDLDSNEEVCGDIILKKYETKVYAQPNKNMLV